MFITKWKQFWNWNAESPSSSCATHRACSPLSPRWHAFLHYPIWCTILRHPPNILSSSAIPQMVCPPLSSPDYMPFFAILYGIPSTATPTSLALPSNSIPSTPWVSDEMSSFVVHNDMPSSILQMACSPLPTPRCNSSLYACRASHKLTLKTTADINLMICD